MKKIDIRERFKCGKLGHNLVFKEPRLAFSDSLDVYCLDCKQIIGNVTSTPNIITIIGKAGGKKT